MLSIRVIPVLLLKDQGLVKGEKFRDHRYVGDPINVVKILNTKEVDELVFFDIMANQNGSKPDYGFLADIASEAFMPFGYGGGLTKVIDIERLFKVGVEKAIINTGALDLNFIRDASRIAGSQSVVASIDVRRSLLGKYEVYTRSGTCNTKMDPVIHARQLEEAGAGELIICSADRDGTLRGYDLELISRISASVSLPVVASGGAGSVEDMRHAVMAGASAVAAGSMFVFHGKWKAVLITYPKYSDLLAAFKERE
ncbi:AglZ/HisF2 family acetamidino modification protein [Castellaniella sp.]|uniref:AglZ/HisF2 family acetamidino modification protein n=1 Tax=Castellaniella sp. TaxID=1955812 RepID=UPI002AFFDD62|nr:AglZ/HisF2 family acetamidino modification protein [Castellaniella sp.]